MRICLTETNACGHSLESSGTQQMLKHPILIPPWSGVGGHLRKTKRREAGGSAGGRGGEPAGSAVGYKLLILVAYGEHVAPSLLAPENPNARNAGSQGHGAFPEGAAGDWAGGREPGSGAGPQGLWKAESRWVLCSCPQGSGNSHSPKSPAGTKGTRLPTVQALRAHLAPRSQRRGRSPGLRDPSATYLPRALKHVTPFWASVSTLLQKPSCPLELVR